MRNKLSSVWVKIPANKTPATTPILREFWNYFEKDSRILEVGCAWGRLIFECLKRDLLVIGIDINNAEIIELKKGLKLGKSENRASVFCMNATKMNFENESFNGAIMQGLLSALESKERYLALKEVFRVLKKHGLLHVAEFEIIDNVEARTRYENDEKITGEFGTLSILDENGKEMFRSHNFSQNELKGLLESVGFKVKIFKKKKFVSFHGNIKPGMLIIAEK